MHIHNLRRRKLATKKKGSSTKIINQFHRELWTDWCELGKPQVLMKVAQNTKCIVNIIDHQRDFFHLPLLPAFLHLISAPTSYLDCGLVTRWPQLLITLQTATHPENQKIKVQWESITLNRSAEKSTDWDPPADVFHRGRHLLVFKCFL